jgi:hypothetical protein
MLYNTFAISGNRYGFAAAYLGVIEPSNFSKTEGNGQKHVENDDFVDLTQRKDVCSESYLAWMLCNTFTL